MYPVETYRAISVPVPVSSDVDVVAAVVGHASEGLLLVLVLRLVLLLGCHQLLIQGRWDLGWVHPHYIHPSHTIPVQVWIRLIVGHAEVGLWSDGRQSRLIVGEGVGSTKIRDDRRSKTRQ